MRFALVKEWIGIDIHEVYMKEDLSQETSLGGHLKKLLGTLFAGIAAITPVVGTALLIIYLYRAMLYLGERIIVSNLLRLLNALRGQKGAEQPWVFEFPGDELVLLFFPLILFFSIGWGVKKRYGAQLLSWVDHMMSKLPLVGFVYEALKQFVDAVRNLGGPQKFKSVAYVEYPSPGCRLIGFVTGEYYDDVRECDVTTIFVPTSPNPATGFVIVVDNDKVLHSNLSLEEAGKMILSAGLVAPIEDVGGKS